jgi:hypothetical protein
MTSTVGRNRPRKPGKADQPPPVSPGGAFEGSGTVAVARADADPATMPPPPPDTLSSAAVSASTMDVSAPMPPQLDEALTAGVGAAGWVYGRTITHVWSYDASTGVWVWVDGIGWKRLSPNSEFGHSHMSLLTTMATDANLTIDYHEDASGRIDQVLA